MMQMELIKATELKAEIRLTGSIENVLYSLVDSGNTVRLSPAESGYSLGLGGIGNTFNEVKNSLGELCTVPQSTGILTAGDENLPIFKSGVHTPIFTPFNVSVGSEFQLIYRYGDPVKSSVAELYNGIFLEMEKISGYKGMIAVSFVFRIEEFYGSLVKLPPLKGSLPEGTKIVDEDRFVNWFGAGADPDKKGFPGISVGVGLDRENCSAFSGEDLDRIFYLHPANAGNVKKQLHNHCFILAAGEIPTEIHDYNEVVDNLLTNNKTVDIKHILDNTIITPYYAGVSVIDSICDLEH